MNYVIRRHFLPRDVDATVRALARNQALYGPATVTGDASWRSGRVAHIEGRPEARAVAEVVLRAVPAVSYALGIDAFAPSRCEVQMSCYGDGDQFRTHTDNGSPDTAERVLSWVIYLDLVTPRTWAGGELHIDYEPASESLQPKVLFGIEDGMAIFFPSWTLHAVLPVTAPDAWEARRHTVNGWVRK